MRQSFEYFINDRIHPPSIISESWLYDAVIDEENIHEKKRVKQQMEKEYKEMSQNITNIDIYEREKGQIKKDNKKIEIWANRRRIRREWWDEARLFEAFLISRHADEYSIFTLTQLQHYFLIRVRNQIKNDPHNCKQSWIPLKLVHF